MYKLGLIQQQQSTILRWLQQQATASVHNVTVPTWQTQSVGPARCQEDCATTKSYVIWSRAALHPSTDWAVDVMGLIIMSGICCGKKSNAWATHPLTDLTPEVAGRWTPGFFADPVCLQLMDTSCFEVLYCWFAHSLYLTPSTLMPSTLTLGAMK